MARNPFLLGFLLVFCIAIAEAEYIKYKDPKQALNSRIKDLLSRMTLQEKIGQMVQIDRSVASPEVMKKHFIGSILRGVVNVPPQKDSAETWINMVNDLQKGSLSTRLGIPLIFGIDAVHGHNNQQSFLTMLALELPGKDPELVKRIGAATALEVRATGIPYVFAPCIAVTKINCIYLVIDMNTSQFMLALNFVCRDPRWGRCYESYSEDPKIVQAMSEIIPGLQGEIPANSEKGVPFVAGNQKVAACAKHFVGDGGTMKGINENNTVINKHGLLSIYMPGYYDSIIKGVATIMVSYSSWNGVKMHANRDLITGFLKNTLRFRGFVISDWEGIDRITSPPHANYSYSIQAGISAGIDMGSCEEISSASKERHADNIGYQCGGWTMEWQGVSGNNFTEGTTILTAIKNTVNPKTEVVYKENPDADFVKLNSFSYAIVVVGEHPYAETVGDSLNLTIPDPGPSTITNVCGAVKCVVIILSGRPVVIQPFVPLIDALVAAWLPGTEGQGVADVLFGDCGFTGKLSRTWFKTVDQLPMNEMARTPIFLMGLLLSCFFIAIAEAEHIRYKDPKQPLNTRIKDLLSRMTLEEKIGQMVQIDRSVASSEVMKKYFIGSILSGGGSVPAQRASPEAWINMVNDFQKGSLSTRLGIPMIYGIDAVHGHNNVYKATIFPHNIGLGATRQVCRDPRWGRCYESYSEDHKIVQAMTEIIPGLQGELPANSRKGIPFVGGNKKVAACAKHYVGDGGTTRGINENNTVINRHGLLSIHMPGYYDSIIKGVATIMVSYSSWNGVKMHANRDLVTGFLKNTLHFRGFVISDWEGIDRITSPPHANYSYSIQAGVNAGIDMVMIPYNYTEFIDGLTSLVKNGIIPMSRIDDAVKRILRVKFVMGLFEEPLADRSLVDQLGSKEHRELAREAVRRSLVLLKNGKSADELLLPLPKKASKILVAGSHADNLGYQCGGWTIEWQGLSGNNLTEGTTILSAIKNTVDPKTKVVYKENPDADFVKSNDFSYAIVVVGEHPYAETFGDSLNLTIPDPGPSAITNVCGSVKCVVIVISGRPVVIQPYVPLMDALVAAWLPGTEGQGVADVLFGDFGFTGKLSRTWFKTVDQLPMNVGDAHYDPLFPFGYGLTTTPANSN
ncbi:hypothetical protein DVH24_019023 [Malus domestica]|uniref:Beta-glucosidase n=1 Tax=Malus domestica TaxID=3750 RepID=A0A498I2A3_MALDO|nr:hypothetical protein DVH24_019023 [Malus domestica]